MDIQRKKLLAILRTSLEFSQLPEDALHDLIEFLELEAVHGGSQILHEGNLSDSMFILVSGRLRVSRRDTKGNLLLYNEIHPGECVGEMGMILHQPRTADITAMRDSILAVLTQNHFEALLKRHPLAINRVFSQAIYNHLRHKQRVHNWSRAQSYAVIPLHHGADAAGVAQMLTAALRRRGPTQHLAGQLAQQDEHFNFDALEADNTFLIYETDAHDSKWTRLAFRQSDQVIFVASADTSPQISQIEQALTSEPGFNLMRKHLALVYPRGTTRCHDKLVWHKERDVERIYPLRAGEEEDIARLARFLVGKAVGVVLGGGGARGFAHLGALRAFEEADIPIDILGGNSMGALIGAAYTFGIPREEIHRQILYFAKKGMWPSLPVVSLLSNANFKSALLELFGDTLIESLIRNYFATACNLSQANTIVLESGPLWYAVLASNSLAGLLPPIIHHPALSGTSQGELLVDGAILENVPVHAMRSRLGTALERRRGNGTVIAIDVDIKEEINVAPDIQELRAWDAIKSRLFPSAHKVPGLASILLHAGKIGGLAQHHKTIAEADYYLEPPVAKFPLMAYKNAEEIIEVGYRYAVEKIASWEKII